MIDRTRRVIIAFDSKIGRSGFTAVCGLDQIDMVITKRPSEEAERWYRKYPVVLRVAQQ